MQKREETKHKSYNGEEYTRAVTQARMPINKQYDQRVNNRPDDNITDENNQIIDYKCNNIQSITSIY